MGIPYQPERGDYVFMDFSPQAGTEQAGHRPALVLTPKTFNIGTGLVGVCPITSEGTQSNFEVPLPASAKLHGFVLAHQFKTIDWMVRGVRFHSSGDMNVLTEVLARIEAILGF